MQTQTTLSFSDCSSSAGRYSNLERMENSSRTYARDSHDSGGEDRRRKFRNAPAEAAEVNQYKGTVPGNSKNIDSSETDQEAEEKDLKGSESERIYNPGGGEEDKKVSPWRREHMFEKTVTPSDVGKLNRLVIPKQQAEKYFPLDTDANEKGLLLSFEDSTGKPWCFRYSYWNSSQSYVLTKGWSRFVKEKKLDAGDIVSFDKATHQDPNLQRLFINSRRKTFCTAQNPGLPVSVKYPLQLRSPFQFPSDAINNIGGIHAQQLVSSRALIGPQWLPLFWQGNNMSGDCSRGAAEMRAPQANSQPMDLCFITTDDKPRKGIHDSGFPVSIQRSSNSRDCGRPAMGTEISVRAPPPLHAIQLKSRGISHNDLSRPLENKVPEAAATGFDHSTSKKVVRLFGVDLECGKLYDNNEDALLIISPSEHLFPRNSKYDNLD